MYGLGTGQNQAEHIDKGDGKEASRWFISRDPVQINDNATAVRAIDDVEISEASGSMDTNAKVLLTMRTMLNSNDGNHILLPHPILIRPKLWYSISIGPFPDQHLFYSKQLKTNVLLSHNFAMVKLRRWNTCVRKNLVHGLVSCLNFNPL